MPGTERLPSQTLVTSWGAAGPYLLSVLLGLEGLLSPAGALVLLPSPDFDSDAGALVPLPLAVLGEDFFA